MKKLFFLIFLFLSCSPLKEYKETANKWQKDIVKLEKLNESEKYSDNAILFIGSSSIRLWKSIQQDLAPYEPIRRAYGGARYTDLIHFTERLVSPHNVKAVGIFVANDITGGVKDLSPKEVLNLTKFIVKQIRKSHNGSIFFIETTPTLKRWKAWPNISLANDLIKAFCESDNKLYYISTRDFYIGENAVPTEWLFVRDKLHLNRKGYKLWGDIIRRNLNDRISLD